MRGGQVPGSCRIVIVCGRIARDVRAVITVKFGDFKPNKENNHVQPQFSGHQYVNGSEQTPGGNANPNPNSLTLTLTQTLTLIPTLILTLILHLTLILTLTFTAKQIICKSLSSVCHTFIIFHALTITTQFRTKTSTKSAVRVSDTLVSLKLQPSPVREDQLHQDAVCLLRRYRPPELLLRKLVTVSL